MKWQSVQKYMRAGGNYQLKDKFARQKAIISNHQG